MIVEPEESYCLSLVFHTVLLFIFYDTEMKCVIQ
jgi:hypothetical protein